MKKIILTVVAAMTMTFGFAETEENQAVVNNAERYDMSFDVRRLADKLQLTAEQMEAVEAISSSLNTELATAAQAKGFDKVIQYEKAIRKDVRNMRRVLNNEQYNTSGRVFYDRFRSEPCDTPEYTQAVIGYIHNVPVKHGRCLTPAGYPWSSFQQLQDSCPEPAEEQILSVRLTEDRRRVFTDYMVAKHIKRLCSIDSIEQFGDLDKKIRRTALAMMRKRGVSYGQLARVTGVTINVVRKARIFVKLPIRKG